MKKLEISEMEHIQGGKLCSDMGIGFVGAGFALLAGGIGVLVGIGAWIGCSLPRHTEIAV